MESHVGIIAINVLPLTLQEFQEQNTDKQNEQCLHNFDLSEYRNVFSEICVWIYQVSWSPMFDLQAITKIRFYLQVIIKTMESRIEKLIVRAVLEYESVTGLSTKRGRKYAKSLKLDPQEAIALLLRELTIFHQVLQLYSVDPTLIAQAFRQVWINQRQRSNIRLSHTVFVAVLFRWCERAEQLAPAQGTLQLGKRHPNPLQYFSFGAMGQRPAHQRARHRYHGLYAASNSSLAAAPSEEKGRGCGWCHCYVFEVDKGADYSRFEHVWRICWRWPGPRNNSSLFHRKHWARTSETRRDRSRQINDGHQCGVRG